MAKYLGDASPNDLYERRIRENGDCRQAGPRRTRTPGALAAAAARPHVERMVGVVEQRQRRGQQHHRAEVPPAARVGRRCVGPEARRIDAIGHDDDPVGVGLALRFIKLHPSSPAFDYALYLRGLVNFNDNLGLFGTLSGQRLAERIVAHLPGQRAPARVHDRAARRQRMTRSPCWLRARCSKTTMPHWGRERDSRISTTSLSE